VITQIDVRGVLARVVPDHLTDLVTRHTGRAVRASIETELSRVAGRTVVVLDFSEVRIIDCSCADEIVAKLVAASLESAAGPDAFYVVRGLSDEQIDDVEEVLRRQRLALVAEKSGSLRLLGEVADQARLVFEQLSGRGDTLAEDLAADLAWTLEEARAALDELAGRRLIMLEAGRYRALNAS
jgi:hypothetical protein